MAGCRKAVVLFVAVVLAPMALATGPEAERGKAAPAPGTQGGGAGIAAEAQRQREQRQMQDERDAHRERAESREKALQGKIQQRRDDMMKNLNRSRQPDS